MSTQETAPTEHSAMPATEGDSVNVAVYLPPSLRARLVKQRKHLGLPYAAVLASAFDRVRPEDLHERLHYPEEYVPGEISGMPSSASWKRAGGGNGVVQMRMRRAQREWLDERVAFHNAPNRNALLVAVLDLGLPPR